jgi:site-specific recombinase XerD
MRDMTLLGPWVRRFLLEYLIGERNLARNTQQSYRDTLCQLIPFVSNRLHKTVDRLAMVDVSAQIVREFLSEIEVSRGCSTATRNQRLAAIHALARFVGEHSPEHIDWCSQLRCVPYKKTTHAVVPYLLWPDTVRELVALAAQRTPQERVFLNRCGQPLTRFGIHAMVERHALKAQVDTPSLSAKHVSPHSIRHSTATHLLRAGVDINTVRAWLGHVSLDTTNIYAEIDLETKAQALAKCEIAGDNKANRRWANNPELMAFLRSL